MSNRKLAVLERYPFYTQASAELKRRIEDSAAAVNLPFGRHFFERGNSCGNIALVGRGTVRVFVTSASGREITLYNVGPGETCPINLMCTLLRKDAPANAIVAGDLEAVIIPAMAFKKWFDEESVVRDFLLEAMSVRLMDLLMLVEEITFHKMDQRLASFLLQRFEGSAIEPPEVQVTQEQIAYELGSAREVISRLLSEFVRQGAVQHGRGRITLQDRVLLTHFAASC